MSYSLHPSPTFITAHQIAVRGELAELSGEPSVANCLKALISLGNAIDLFVQYLGFMSSFRPLNIYQSSDKRQQKHTGTCDTMIAAKLTPPQAIATPTALITS